jgi:hypothetical protein
LQVVRYVENYCKASRFAARNARLTNITLDSMTAVSGSNTYTIPIEPPMASLAEARPRVIEMDAASIKALGRSSITLKEYRRPKGFGAFMFAFCTATIILCSREETGQPGSLIYDNFLRNVPPLAELVPKARLKVLYTILGLHVIETYIGAGKLKKHSFPLFSPAWWGWIGTFMVEGFTTFSRYVLQKDTDSCNSNHVYRFDGLVEEKRKEKEKEKH